MYIEKRIARLERLNELLRLSVRLLYHRTYATTLRAGRVNKGRANYYHKLQQVLHCSQKRIANHARKLGILTKHMQQGKRVVLLTPVEMMRFKAWLKKHPGRSHGC